MDPLSNMKAAGTTTDSQAMLVRLVDYLRSRMITLLLVSLTGGGQATEATDEDVSSIVDTWLLVRDVELDGERNRALYVLKSRGMPHSNQVREFLITSKGVDLVPAYLGTGGVLTGSARLNQEARDRMDAELAKDELLRKKLALEHRRKAIKAQMEALSAGFAAEEEEYHRYETSRKTADAVLAGDRAAMSKSRKSS
jgi:circadian clock protein KaiC